MMADETLFYGNWKIIDCLSLTGVVEPTGIEGTEFQLYESGDVSWKLSENTESMPFFSCETYEFDFGEVLPDEAVLKFFGNLAGHVIEFKVKVQDDLMNLTYEQCCMLQCQKVSSTELKDLTPFSFLDAFDEGYFSDLTIISQAGKEYQVHCVVLKLAIPEVDWNASTCVLSGLPDNVLHTILYYIYSECLPVGLLEETAQACINATSKLEGFTPFLQLCQTFLKNTALKQQITSLISDMHACADRIIDLFSIRIGEASDESLMENPDKLCTAVKQALREGSVACMKFLILCDLFSRRKGELSRAERHEIIKYARSRLPVFMNQLHKCLELCKQHVSSLTPAQRNAMAAYLVPEIETGLETISTFILDTKTALEQVIMLSSNAEKAEKAEKQKKSHVGDILGKKLRHALHTRELLKLKTLHEKTAETFTNLMQKNQSFTNMTNPKKIRNVSRALEHMIDEIPLFLVRIKELMVGFNEKITWRKWKYLFKLSTSKISWMLNKTETHRSILEPMLLRSCDLIQRDQYRQSLTTLKLMDHPAATITPESSSTAKQSTISTKYAQLSAVESLCQSPYACDSTLAAKAQNLINSQQDADMIFEIITSQDCSDTLNNTDLQNTDPHKFDKYSLSAHRVIVAARCDWFRRALLSGMRESIDRKITIHDTNPELFKLYVTYLYTGQLNTQHLSTEQLADMIAIADRYETDSLKLICEEALTSQQHLTEDTALFLFSLADQYNAHKLKSSSMSFILSNQSVRNSEIFNDMPDNLQMEIEAMLAWDDLDAHSDQFGESSSFSSDSELMGNLSLGDGMSRLSFSSSEDLPPAYNAAPTDHEQLDECVAELRNIVGDEVTHAELTRIVIAADYNVNRALNFYYSN